MLGGEVFSWSPPPPPPPKTPNSKPDFVIIIRSFTHEQLQAEKILHKKHVRSILCFTVSYITVQTWKGVTKLFRY